VVSVRPAIFIDGAFAPLAADLDQMGHRDAIYATFSEEPDPGSVADAFRLSPTLHGRVIQDGPRDFAFVPDEGYAARTRYRLCISSSVSDLAGNTMSEDHVTWFSPRVADLKVARAFVEDGPAITDFGDTRSHAFCPRIPDGSALVALEFSSPISDAGQRDRVVTLVSCSSLFPPALSPSLTSARWVGDSRLELGYAGFSPSSASKTCYYRLSVPGGTSGISDGSGGSMEADLWLVMCAE
jgi:hypothetical protein